MIKLILCLLFCLPCFDVHAEKSIYVLTEDVYPQIEKLTEELKGGRSFSIDTDHGRLKSIAVKDQKRVYILEGKIFDGIGDPELSTAKWRIAPYGKCSDTESDCEKNAPIPVIEMEVDSIGENQECETKCIVSFYVRRNASILRQFRVLKNDKWIHSQEFIFPARENAN